MIGILDLSSQSNTLSNNAIGNITINLGGTCMVVGFRGVYATSDSSQLGIINDNAIANITDNIVGNYATYGIYNEPSATGEAGH